MSNPPDEVDLENSEQPMSTGPHVADKLNRLDESPDHLSEYMRLDPGVRTPEALFTEALRTIWRLAHEDRAWSEDRWQWFQRVVNDALEPSRILAEAREREATHDGPDAPLPPLEGDIETLTLLLSIELEQMAGDAQRLSQFVTGRLADAVERLEAEDAGTPEQRVDLALAALAPLSELRTLDRLAIELGRHLLIQNERGSGYVVTLANLAMLALPGDAAVPLLLYHLALRETRRLVQTPERGQDENLPRVVNNAAHNMAAILGRRYQRAGRPEHGGRMSEAIRSHLILSAVHAPAATVDEAVGLRVLRVLAAPTVPQLPIGDHVAVIEEIGSTPFAWASRYSSIARLEAMSAVAAALAGKDAAVPSRLFNAGISLLRDADRDTPMFIRARMVANGSGLLWALTGVDVLPDAFRNIAALDCAVNLLGSMTDSVGVYRELPPEQQRVARMLLSLTRWEPLAASNAHLIRAKVGRLVAGGRRLEAPETGGTPDAPEFREALRDLLNQLVPESSTQQPLGQTDARIHELAGRIAAAFESVSDPEGDRHLTEEVSRIIAARLDPAQMLVQESSFTSEAPDDPVGISPVVARDDAEARAGFVPREEWHALAQRIAGPLPRITPLLRNLNDLID